MNDKKYLDKIIKYFVSRTKIDYDKEEIIFPFLIRNQLSSFGHSFSKSFHPFYLIFPFAKYCKNMFGLTEDETEYVYMVYMETLKDKIEDGQ